MSEKAEQHTLKKEQTSSSVAVITVTSSYNLRYVKNSPDVQCGPHIGIYLNEKRVATWSPGNLSAGFHELPDPEYFGQTALELWNANQ